MITHDTIDDQIQLFYKIGLAARIKKDALFDDKISKKIGNELATALANKTTSNCTTLNAVVHYVSANA